MRLWYVLGSVLVKVYQFLLDTEYCPWFARQRRKDQRLRNTLIDVCYIFRRILMCINGEFDRLLH